MFGHNRKILRIIALIIAGIFIFWGIMAGISAFAYSSYATDGTTSGSSVSQGTEPGADPGTGDGTGTTGDGAGTTDGGGTGEPSDGSGSQGDSGTGTGDGAGQDSNPPSNTGNGTESSSREPDKKPAEEEPPEEEERPPSKSSSVSFNISAKPTMHTGETQRIIYTLSGASSETKVVWASSDPGVASIDANGEVTAIAPGTVEIKAEAAGIKRTALIKVENLTADSIRIFSDEFEAADLLRSKKQLLTGDSLQLGCEILPEEAGRDAQPVWETSDQKVATIDETGLLEAVGKGDVTVTVTFGEISDTMDFEVTKKGAPAALLLLILFFVLMIALAAVLVFFFLRKKKRREEEERLAREAAQRRRAPSAPGQGARPHARRDGMVHAPAAASTKPFAPRQGMQDRMTRVYDVSPTGEGGAQRSETPAAWSAAAASKDVVPNMDRGPDRPFTLDDIE
ncbi:MAG: Ig-like domain-containing protein [Clostridiales Family XIII bacterium]|jgi:flagellar basal body-associated protein FliL|nr:Ig-like domain-containing protein [Clostridiales Family XIII bacterium]